MRLRRRSGSKIDEVKVEAPASMLAPFLACRQHLT